MRGGNEVRKGKYLKEMNEGNKGREGGRRKELGNVLRE